MAEAGARQLTELENCVLAVIWRRGPCSAYAVRREFASSSSPAWSASAGSIYPVISRLRTLGLVVAENQPWGGKGKTVFNASPAGVEQVRRWITAVPEALVAAPPDPVRTRAFFLDAAGNRAEQLRLLDVWERQTREELARDRRDVAASTASALDKAAASGTAFALEARLRWVAHMRKALTDGGL